jgi:hypothetical protein
VPLQQTVAIRLREKSSRRLEQDQSHFEVGRKSSAPTVRGDSWDQMARCGRRGK